MKFDINETRDTNSTLTKRVKIQPELTRFALKTAAIEKGVSLIKYNASQKWNLFTISETILVFFGQKRTLFFVFHCVVFDAC